MKDPELYEAHVSTRAKKSLIRWHRKPLLRAFLTNPQAFLIFRKEFNRKNTPLTLNEGRNSLSINHNCTVPAPRTTAHPSETTLPRNLASPTKNIWVNEVSTHNIFIV